MQSEPFTANDDLILVDGQNNIIGYETKAKCHEGTGMLHRAFSIFVFNENKQLLLQKRSALKPLWPLYWSNSVCSHPRRGEDDVEAAHRRLNEEIHIDIPLTFLFDFRYQAAFHDRGSENERCSVYIGITNSKIIPNPEEIAEWKYVDLAALDQDLDAFPDHYTPWFNIEWRRIRSDFMTDVHALTLSG
ncbi:MAG: isopentenyl-diphosphate Delta-isomerase [Candidatus Omnitrophota bacterium]